MFISTVIGSGVIGHIATLSTTIHGGGTIGTGLITTLDGIDLIDHGIMLYGGQITVIKMLLL
tara:strand:+ start:242 stop:427 length:186 start_codon:yes stop_codon:yes gene_type:complete